MLSFPGEAPFFAACDFCLINILAVGCLHFPSIVDLSSSMPDGPGELLKFINIVREDQPGWSPLV